MKTFLNSTLIILGICFLSINTSIGQKTIALINDGASFSSDIEESIKEEIIKEVQDILNNYYNIATFWDEVNDQFDEDKYTQFISLFSGSARVYEDIKDEPTNIEYSVYANNVFQYMQEEGVQFDLENAYLNSVEKDESGFYVADLDMDKIIFVGLDKDNFPVKLGDGKRYTLNVKIDMPDYDVTDGKIQSIVGQEAAKRVATATYLSGNFMYGLGSFIEGAATSDITPSFGELTSRSASTLGFQLFLRKSLSQKENLWFNIGVGGQQHTLTTGFDNFDNSVLASNLRSEAPFTGAKINGNPPTDYVEENGQPLIGNLTIDKLVDSKEVLNVITVDVPIGISYRAYRTFSSRLFLDLSIVPSYSVSSNGGVSGTAEGFNIPNSIHFPDIADIEAQSDGQQRLSSYVFEGSFSDNEITTESNFGLGVQFSPSYHYEPNFRYGIEIGFNLWYNVLSLVKSVPSENGYLSSTYANESFGTKTSILQDYFEGVSPFYASIKLGFFYKLN